MTDAKIRLAYLEEVIRMLYPPSAVTSPRTLLPHRLVPRRLVPRAPWHVGGRVQVHVGPDSVEAHLSDVLGQRVRAVLHVRPARRANRKPVLEAHGEGGLLAFAKIGTPVAADLVRHEAAVLRMVAERPAKVVVAPTVLHHGVWRGLEVLVLSPLPAVRRPVPRDLLHLAIREIAGWHGDEPAHAWHGDLSPWNVSPSPDGRLLVWDWERFGAGVPLGFDAMHHFFHRALRRMPPAVAARACLAQAGRLLEPYGVAFHQARGTAAHYLVTLADRHHRDGHEPLGPPAAWLYPVIDDPEAFL
ncbi:hypothetical protein J5X84_32215 [Streptosporangiaceae bacterium NEAU-GS5]|nr:hypothetical protein [Streptosporangiaceae bacterium NEAU-GS5]